MIESILTPDRTDADAIEELIIEPITREHFLQATAPQEYYSAPKAVSDDEIAAFRENVADRMIEKALLSGQRKEAVAFGLLDAALELCTRIVQEAGEKYPEQGGQYLADAALRRLGGKAIEKSLEDEEDA
jgi:hypothetical protein